MKDWKNGASLKVQLCCPSMFLYETIPLDWSKASIEGWWRSTRKKSTKGSDFFWTGGGAIGHPWIFIPMSTKAVCLFVSYSTNKPSTFRPQDGPLGLSTYFFLPKQTVLRNYQLILRDRVDWSQAKRGLKHCLHKEWSLILLFFIAFILPSGKLLLPLSSTL